MIYLDSAFIEEVESAVAMGWVKGVTTNPTLLNKVNLSPEVCLKQLTAICPGELYYQLCARDFPGMVAEASKAREIIGDKIVLKIPATELGFRVTAHLSSSINCSVTAIYSPAQAAIASEAGAKYAIAYVNRATRLLGDGLALVREMSEILKDSKTEILAASLKSPEEVAATLQAGADHLTVPMSILNAMATHELSEKTVAEFTTNGIGITGY
ncbi:transaldolase [Waterburya agarophytonicola K14]|uniref:Transaldolase n=1 Tax=Waterburya agarophytonicola KI4 TaxID=2874699 RepID=A0A964BSI7_9CYAN|nr:transaldolase family protein [Waterburya agarophytonicola]MCC0178909.1 transaldolase [Waterburya agarophytonicola KI4]